MPRAIVLHARLDATTTAAYAHLEADRSGSSISEWIASLIRRELRQAGAAARGPGLDEIRAPVAAHPGLIKRLSPTP